MDCGRALPTSGIPSQSIRTTGPHFDTKRGPRGGRLWPSACPTYGRLAGKAALPSNGDAVNGPVVSPPAGATLRGVSSALRCGIPSTCRPKCERRRAWLIRSVLVLSMSRSGGRPDDTPPRRPQQKRAWSTPALSLCAGRNSQSRRFCPRPEFLQCERAGMSPTCSFAPQA